MLKAFATIAAAGLAAAAPAQTGGGLGGLLGGALPNVGSIGAGNAAGLLGYCIKNNLLGGAAGAPPSDQTSAAAPTGARAILDRLAGRQGVEQSPGYAAGQAGQVQTPGGTLPLGSLRGQIKNQVCKLVLNRARSFL